MINSLDAALADEFHIYHGPHIPCAVWHRTGETIYGPGECQFRVGLTTRPARENGRYITLPEFHAITPVNAGDFHVGARCPCSALRVTAPAAGNSGRPEDSSAGQPALPGTEPEYDADGYDAEGYNRRGYNVFGFDRAGYDAEGYNEDDLDRYGRPRPVDVSELDLAELWSEFTSSTWLSHVRRREFTEHLRGLVTDPDDIDALEFCDHCEDPAWGDDMSSAHGDVRVCDSCWGDMSTCYECDGRFPDDDLSQTLSEHDVCERCRDHHYSYCDDCGGWYRDEYADDHEHDDDGGCCEAPQQVFEIRNDGCPALASDSRATITLPAGHISAEGLGEIRDYLRRKHYALDCGSAYYDLAYDLEKLGAEWQTREGNYTKRLSRHAYKTHQLKLDQEDLSQIGNIARDHSNAVSVEIEITRDLNMSAGEFYHEDSCWWNSYSESRCALKTNGGFGMRSFSAGSNMVSGRAWVMPLKLDEHRHLTPTFETRTPDAFVVFNGYGDLSGYAPARIIAHMAGWTYRKIGFSCHPMYINAGGYIIAAEELAAKYTDGSLSLSVSQHSRLFDTERTLVNA